MPRRETVKCLVLGAAAGPAVQYLPINLGDQSVAVVKGWQGSGLVGAPNVWVFTGRLSLAECQSRLLSSDGSVDGVCLASSAATEWNLDEDTRALTIFYEIANTSGQTQSANLVIKEFTRERWTREGAYSSTDRPVSP